MHRAERRRHAAVLQKASKTILPSPSQAQMVLGPRNGNAVAPGSASLAIGTTTATPTAEPASAAHKPRVCCPCRCLHVAIAFRSLCTSSASFLTLRRRAASSAPRHRRSKSAVLCVRQ